jgi:uncharacterized protein YdeI (YjbR/CyaY-like superfamily)
MGTRDSRIDAYIRGSAAFARPILRHLRAVVHEGCPDVEETIKWGMPHFDHHGIMCSMAAFKAHCAFGFWHAKEVLGEALVRDSMGAFGRITSIDDLPSRRTLVAYVRKAARLREAGVKLERRRRTGPPPRTPSDLAAALRGNPRAAKVFRGFSPSMRREYIEWITEAKTDATRLRRLATALEWIAEGRERQWKYQTARRRP